MRKLSYLLLALVLALPLFPALAQGDPVVARLEEYNAALPAGYGNVSVEDLSVEMLENSDLLIVDVRQPEEYNAEEGHLPGAINIPLREVAQHLDLLPDLDQPIVVYCGSAFRSTMAMTSLQVLGYSDVRNMKGGFKAWQAEEYAVETEPTEAVAGEAPVVDGDVLAAVDAQLSSLPEGWGAVTAENLNVELVENPPDVLIDVRTQKEWDEQGYIAGAVLMPLESFMSFMDQWPADKGANVVIYCAAGHRGNMAATLMRTLGYTNVRNLSGGFGAWTTAGLAVETPMAEMGDPVVARLEEYNAALPAGYGNVSVEDLSVEMLENSDLLIVDVRQPEEYNAEEGHLPGAINIPLREVAQHLDLLPDLDQPIVVYCGSAFRSTMAMTSLQVLGYSDVRNMKGGFKAWQAEEYAVETEPTEAVAGEAPVVDADVLAAVDAQLSGLPEGWGAVTAENLNVELVENPPDVLIDVRTQKEWDEQGYIAGAVLMPLESFMSFMDQWPADKGANVVIYCAAGHRGNMAATLMRTLGYTNVRNLSGGFGAWTTAGLAVEGAPAK